MKYHNIDYSYAIGLAGHIMDEVNGINENEPYNFFYGYDQTYIDEFLAELVKPQKKTMLHHYIEDIHIEGFQYYLRKGFLNDMLPQIYEVLENIGIQFTEYDESDDYEEEYEDYIEKLFYSVTDEIVDATFSILFLDKRFLEKFNRQIAEIIVQLKKSDYPDLMKKDGVVKRCTYIPTWLKKGVFYRDRGRCQICGKDLTMLLGTSEKVHYDHIIPLDASGNNDPTNFQLTCETCNTSKGVNQKKLIT